MQRRIVWISLIYQAVSLAPLCTILSAQSHEKRLTPVDATQRESFSKATNVAVVGVSDYASDTGLQKLQYADHDAQAIAAELRRQNYAVRLLVNTEATRSRIVSAVREAGEVVTRDGTLLFFFSGHGFAPQAGRNYLATFGVTADELAQDGLSVDDLRSRIAQTQARRKVLFVDACRSEAGKGGARTFASLAASSGLQMLLSTQMGRISYENDQLQQGVFTYFLLKALRGEAAGADGFVTFRDVSEYVTSSVRQWSFERNQTQIPVVLSDEVTGDFLLAKSTSVISEDPVVMTVGNEKITSTQFEQIIGTLTEQQHAQAQLPGGKRKLAEQLAEMLALAQEGRARKIDQISSVQLQIKTQTDAALAQGTGQAPALVQARARLLTDQIIAGGMWQELLKEQSNGVVDGAPTDAALHAYYDAHKSDWEEVAARHILIRFKGSSVPIRPGKKDLTEAEALAKIREIRARIIAGAKFEDEAKAETDDSGTTPNGGDLGSFGRGQMVAPFEQAAFAAQIGRVTEPVKSQFGYHLILVEARSMKPFEQARGQIEQKIKQDAQQQSRRAVDGLKAKKNITYNEAYFGR
jgi:peptidyl-prolyl cis-trans isomerase C